MKKIFFSLTLVLIMLVSVCVLPASASSEIIENVDINAVINADGTVNVTEKWTVSYGSASDYFYRNIDKYGTEGGPTLLQNYTAISDVNVYVDGKALPPSDIGINTYTFGESEDGRSYEFAVCYPSAQITREYEIVYTLEGAVKKKSGDAVFSFLFFGKTLLYSSNNITVTVSLPEGTADDSVVVGEEHEYTCANGNVVFNKNRVGDVYGIEVTFDKGAFEDGALVSYSGAAEVFAGIKNSLSNILPWIIAVIAVIAIILLVLLPEKLIRIPAERSAAKLAKDEANADITLPEGMTACQAYKILVPQSRIRPKTTTKKVTSLFAMSILECMENGYIVPEDNGFIVGTPENNAPAYIMSTLNFLKTFCETENDRYVLDARFAEKVTAECMTRYDVITNYLATFYGLIPSADAKYLRTDKEKYENACVLKINASSIKAKPSFAQCINAVLGGKKTSEKEIFAMLLSSSNSDKLFAKGENAGQTALCTALGEMYKVFVKSK